MLTRKLANKNHYPAIDVLQSISRCMSQIATKEHKMFAGKLKATLATVQRSGRFDKYWGLQSRF